MNLRRFRLRSKVVEPCYTESHSRNFHPKGDGGSGRRPLPPDHLTFDRLNIERVYSIAVFELV